MLFVCVCVFFVVVEKGPASCPLWYHRTDAVPTTTSGFQAGFTCVDSLGFAFVAGRWCPFLAPLTATNERNESGSLSTECATGGGQKKRQQPRKRAPGFKRNRIQAGTGWFSDGVSPQTGY